MSSILNLLAHHPGVLGPINHLGAGQIAGVVGVALLDGLNPTAIAIFLLILWDKSQPKRKTKSAIAYIFGILVTYLVAGILLRLAYADFGPNYVILSIQLLFALLLFFSGVNELSNSLKPSNKKLITVPKSMQKLINRFSARTDSLIIVFIVGVVVGLVELFTTGAMYLSFIQAVTFDPTASIWVVLTLSIIYLFVFLTPLLMILFYRPVLESIANAKANNKHGRIIRSVAGLLFVCAALYIAASAVVTIMSI